MWPGENTRWRRICVVRSRVVKENKMAKHHPDLIMCRKQPGVGKTLFIL